jgi:hypothetical protein
MSIILLVVTAVCWLWISPQHNTEFIHQKKLHLSDQQEMSKPIMPAYFPVRVLSNTKQPYDNEFYCDVNVNNVQCINSFRSLGCMTSTEKSHYSLVILPNKWWYKTAVITTSLNVLQCITCAEKNVNFLWTSRTSYKKFLEYFGFDRARLYIKYKLLKRKYKELIDTFKQKNELHRRLVNKQEELKTSRFNSEKINLIVKGAGFPGATVKYRRQVEKLSVMQSAFMMNFYPGQDHAPMTGLSTVANKKAKA